MMKTKLFLATLLAGLMSTTALAQTAAEAEIEIPARINETVFVESPDDHVLGDDLAVQTMIVYASVSCPHCSGWFTEEWPKIKTELVESGIMRFVFREFPTAPAELSLTGFMLAECGPTESYFDLIEYQMENQQHIFQEAKEGRARETYDKIAAMAGMETQEAIAACLSNPDMIAHIQDNGLRANLGKVRGVPAFFINGETYNGPQDAQSLVTLITQMDEKGVTALPSEFVQSDEAPHAHDATTGHQHD